VTGKEIFAGEDCAENNCAAPKEASTVFVVDDDDDFRESLVWLLESERYHCKSYTSAEAFLAAYNDERGVMLLDVRMQGMSGLNLLQELNAKNKAIPVIMITGHGDVAMAVGAMKNNAVDFISKPFDDGQMLQLLANVFETLDARFDDNKKLGESEASWASLTSREQQVATLVINGHSNKSASQQLGISVKTVEIHRSRVMKKMQADSLASLMRLMIALEV